VFSNRVINIWNSLPGNIVATRSIPNEALTNLTFLTFYFNNSVSSI